MASVDRLLFQGRRSFQVNAFIQSHLEMSATPAAKRFRMSVSSVAPTKVLQIFFACADVCAARSAACKLRNDFCSAVESAEGSAGELATRSAAASRALCHDLGKELINKFESAWLTLVKIFLVLMAADLGRTNSISTTTAPARRMVSAPRKILRCASVKNLFLLVARARSSVVAQQIHEIGRAPFLDKH